jgi:hypothetical protein
LKKVSIGKDVLRVYTVQDISVIVVSNNDEKKDDVQAKNVSEEKQVED